MSKYEVGDRVLLRKDLEVGELYKDCSLVESMKQYLGKEATNLISNLKREYLINNEENSNGNNNDMENR